jgi:hypothetical protein
MTTEGLLSLCHALRKLEAAQGKPSEPPCVRLCVVRTAIGRARPKLLALPLERRPVQVELDWPCDQLPLPEGVRR